MYMNTCIYRCVHIYRYYVYEYEYIISIYAYTSICILIQCTYFPNTIDRLSSCWFAVWKRLLLSFVFNNSIVMSLQVQYIVNRVKFTRRRLYSVSQSSSLSLFLCNLLSPFTLSATLHNSLHMFFSLSFLPVSL